MKYSLSLGKFFGIKVQIHWTFLILLIWIVISNMLSAVGVVQTLWVLLFVLSVFLCVVLHEFGHALVAKRFGIKTIDITLLPIGGVARLETIPEKPKEELLVALAGPLVNVLIALLLFALMHAPLDINTIKQLSSITSINFVANLFYVNLTLTLFNLIPAFPMDGGRILRALLSFKMDRTFATRVAATIGQVLAIGFAILGFFGNPFLIFIGFFVFLGAQAEVEYTQAKSMLKGFTVNDVLMKKYQVIDVEDSIKSAVELLLDGQANNFLVMKNSHPFGTLNRDEIIKALTERGESALVLYAMNTEMMTLHPDMPLEEAWGLIQRKKSLMPVLKNDVLLGVVDTENILEFILVQSALKA